MDPITAAFVAALAAGVTEVGKNMVVDAYNELKSLFKKKFGNESKVIKAVNDLEEEKDSKGRQLTLQEQIAKVKADQDPDLLQAAQNVLDHLRAQPDGEQHIQNAYGSNIAQADRGSTASVNINHPKEA